MVVGKFGGAFLIGRKRQVSRVECQTHAGARQKTPAYRSPAFYGHGIICQEPRSPRFRKQHIKNSENSNDWRFGRQQKIKCLRL